MARAIDLAECIGCGACEAACPQDAISQSETFPVTYQVDALICNDCQRCETLCPVDGFAIAEGWAICHGRGCPLSSRRYEGVECSEGQACCATCGSVLWRRPGEDWACASCQAVSAGRARAGCPKTRRAARTSAAAL